MTDPPNRIVTVLLCYSALSGVLFLTGVYAPRSIDMTLAPALQIAWGAGLAAGGLLALAGQYWPWRPFTGARVKRLGLILAAGGMLAAGCAIWVVNGIGAGGFAAGTNLAFGLAFADRARQIGGLLKEAQPHAEAIKQKTDRGGGRGRGASG